MFDHLLTDVCTVSAYLGPLAGDPYQSPTYGPKVATRCAWAQSAQKVRDSDGNERVSADQLASGVKIGLKDKVWLPGEDVANDDVAHTPIAIRNDASRSTGTRLYQTFF